MKDFQQRHCDLAVISLFFCLSKKKTITLQMKDPSRRVVLLCVFYVHACGYDLLFGSRTAYIHTIATYSIIHRSVISTVLSVRTADGSGRATVRGHPPERLVPTTSPPGLLILYVAGNVSTGMANMNGNSHSIDTPARPQHKLSHKYKIHRRCKEFLTLQTYSHSIPID
jgi:hypothetical protein